MLPVREAVRDDALHDRGRPGRPGLPAPDEVRRPGLHRGGRQAAGRGEGVDGQAADGDKWRRVVPSPLPKRIFQIRPIRWLLDHGVIVICAGGGGIPTMYGPGSEAPSASRRSSTRTGQARCWPASSRPTCFVMATDADAVYLDWGTPEQKAIRPSTPMRCRDGRPVSRRVDGAEGRGGGRLRAHRRRLVHRGSLRASTRCCAARPAPGSRAHVDGVIYRLAHSRDGRRMARCGPCRGQRCRLHAAGRARAARRRLVPGR